MRQNLPMIGGQSPERAGLLEIRAFEQADFRRVSKILGLAILGEQYGAGSKILSWEEWDARFAEPRLVAVLGPQVLAWAGVRAADQPEAEGALLLDLHIDPVARGHGIEAALLDEFLHVADAAGIPAVQAELFDDQAGQVARLEDAGFRQVAVRERAGQLAGMWRDVVVLTRPNGG